MLICAIWSHLKLTVRNSTVENRLEFFDNSNLTLSRVPWFNLIAHSRGQKNSYFSTLLSLSLRDSTSFLIRVKKRFHFFQTEFTRALWTRRRKLGRIVCRSGGGKEEREGKKESGGKLWKSPRPYQLPTYYIRNNNKAMRLTNQPAFSNSNYYPFRLVPFVSPSTCWWGAASCIHGVGRYKKLGWT